MSTSEPSPHPHAAPYRPGRRVVTPRCIDIPGAPLTLIPLEIHPLSGLISLAGGVPLRDTLRLPMAHKVARRRIRHTLRGHLVGAVALLALVAVAIGGLLLAIRALWVVAWLLSVVFG